ncbi:dephospho-CoA kinase [Saccharopolyspora antimicrobica]|uniref:Dephospho-CoA kinase n=1 Tax=Saccharopolyspora antimicrobica TaxID=455193 RepID=A0A1I5FIN1_9PSEU|nr:dephospho-CoA kinase [Saccharopolyspora antimicrobica]RKT82157.1 dephospho-CoA kinase [Saccharopolyspora antimicrobica]SFO23171.1 dephospho-CoA kinase [Saccharopolyspora antimicrobica]
MLRVGLSGGIGSGKSTVARRLAELGAVLVDADVLAREVVRPGSPGLAEIVERFGADVLDADGALNRPALAAKAFADDQARADLNAITHPKIRDLTAERMAGAPADAVVVHDVPLLVEAGYAPNYHLVVIVDAPEDVRVRRLVERGLTEQDARARIAAQATTEQRREVADAWLDNSGPVEELVARVDALWRDRLVPFEENVRLRRRPPKRSPRLVGPDPDWPRQAQRLIDRIERVAGDKAVRVDHIGSTSVPGLPAKDIIDLQLTVRSLADADELAEPLAEAGFPPIPEITADTPHAFAPDPAQWEKRIHVSADPARYANLHVRPDGSPSQQLALQFPAWLRADEDARAGYLALKREVANAHANDPSHDAYADAKEPWFAKSLPEARAWAQRTGWTPGA